MNAHGAGGRRDGLGRIAATPLLLVVGFGVIYASLSWFALHGFPFSGDEYSSYLQAELFARGLLHAPAPAHPDLLRVDHVVIDSLVRSKYPPGAAALLALGVRANVPWLVTPVEAVVALGATWWTAREHLGARSATVAVVTLGLAPLFAFQAATFFGHTATTMWLALAFLAVSMWARMGGTSAASASSKRSGAWPILAGAAIGCAFLTRPGDAVFFAAALLVFRSPRLLLLAGAGALPFVLVLFAYQAAQFGSPFADGYHAYEPTFRAIYGESTGHPISFLYLFDPKEQANHLDVVRAFALEWTIPGTVLVALAGAHHMGPNHPARAMRNFALAVAAVPIAMLLITVADPDDGARARYLSVVLLPVAFFAGPGLEPVLDALRSLVGANLTKAAVAFAVVAAPVQVGAFLGRRIPELWVREGLFREVQAERVTEGVVVVRAEWPTRYARNGPFFDRPVLYLSAPQDMSSEQVAALYPGRRVYEAIEGRKWKLVRRI